MHMYILNGREKKVNDGKFGARLMQYRGREWDQIKDQMNRSAGKMEE